MAFWSFYFLLKIVLYFRGGLNLDMAWNVAFCVFLLIPTPKWMGKIKVLGGARFAVDLILALLLLWHDSWFPPIMQTIAFVKQQGLPSKEYIFNFLARYYSFDLVTLSVVALAIIWGLNKYINLVTVSLVAFVAMGSWNAYAHRGESKKEVASAVESFFDYESSRMVTFKPPKSGVIDFDIIMIHVCSLAWDDIYAVQLEQDKFWNQFQLLFTNFNGVTSYSGPAALRVLRTPCGQPKHSDLYNPAPDECYLFDDFKKLGFDTSFVLNHDGKFGDFAGEIKKLGHVNKPFMPLEGLPVESKMFDGSVMAMDYDALSKWWGLRQHQAKSAPAALYYNTVSLHDGSHWASDPNWFRRDHKEMFKEFLVRLLSDVSKFIRLLEGSGRNVVVVFIPEHGFAYRGSAIQTSGLRDIPLPSITNLPVGIKFIGSKFNGNQVRKTAISKPVSYLGLGFLLSNFVEHSPFNGDSKLKRLIEEMPTTEFMTENEGARIFLHDGKFLYSGKDGKWVELSPEQMK